MMRRVSLLFCVLALTLALSGCWTSDEVTDEKDFWEESPTDQTQEEPDAALTPITAFVLPYLKNVTFDPIACPDGMQQTVGALLYEGLFTLDGSFAPQNVLCSRYEHNDDCTSYTFYLREGVCFSDGSALTANDVLAAYRRAQTSERYRARFASVVSMRVVNGALTVALSQGNSAFPALLDIPIVKSGSEKDTVPLGTGPYLFVTDGSGACLKRSADWWQDARLPLERIELREDNRFYIKDASTPTTEGTTDATEFQPAMIIDGVKYTTDVWTDSNPRACIGQSDKYEILMLVIEGRLWLEGINGTSVNTCSDILLQHGCMQAMNLDGGSSAMMWFDGKYVMRSSSPDNRYNGGRPAPNAWVYKAAGTFEE